MSGYVDLYTDIYTGDDLSNYTFPLIYSPGIVHPVVFPFTGSSKVISSVAVVAWETIASVVSQKATSWKIPQQGVTSQANIQWNTEFRVKHNDLGFVSGLNSPIVHPFDWHYTPAGITWDVDQRRSSSSRISWKVIQRRKSDKASAYNILTKDYSFQQTDWKVLKRIYVPGTTSFNFFNGISQPIVHPFDSQNTTFTPQIAWNLNARLRLGESIRWNILGKVKSQAASLWNTLCVLVQKQGEVSWYTRSPVKKLGAVAWAMQERYYKRAKIAWNSKSSVVSQKAASFNVHNFVRVLKVLTTNYMLSMPVVHPFDIYETVNTEIQWNFNQRISSKQGIRWNVLLRDPGYLQIGWNTLFRISIPNYTSIYYPGILQPIIHPFTLKTYPWGPRITWNLGTSFVTSQQSSSWRTLNKVSKKAQISWSTVQRTSSNPQILWDTFHTVVSQDIIEWNVGQNIPTFIRQTSISRQDFAY